VSNGTVCYLEIPAADLDASAGFYQRVFGWSLRGHADTGRPAFDTPGGVSGQFVLNRPPSRDAGVVTYVMVEDMDITIEAVVANGGEVVQPPFDTGGGAPAATFRDPFGNLFGLYQERR